jgi:hypothetical protein
VNIIERLKLITWGIDPYMMNEAVLLLLFDAIDKLQTDLPIVEIGIHTGRTTRAMAMYCNAIEKPNTVYGVDPFERFVFVANTEMNEPNTPGLKDEAIKNLKGCDNVVMVDGFSWAKEVLETIPEAAMVFLDADHSTEAVKKDLQNWLPRTKEFFIMHDTRYQSVQNALNELGIPFVKTLWNCGVVKGWEDCIEGGWFHHD